MGSCAAPSAKGDDKFITTDYLQQCRFINQRQREGIAIAKEKGVYQGKPKNAELRKTLAKLFARGMSAEEAAKVAKCGRATAFRIKKELSEASSGK